MTNMNLTLTQLLTSAKASHLPQGMLSAFTDLESQKDVGKNKMDGSAEKELEPALKIMEEFIPLTEEEYLDLSMKGLSILKQNPEWREAYGTPVA